MREQAKCLSEAPSCNTSGRDTTEFSLYDIKMDSDVEESPCDDADVDQCSICIEALGQNSSEVRSTRILRVHGLKVGYNIQSFRSQQDFDKDLAASACSCGHVFHTGCLRQWLRIKSWCPTCKTKQHLNSSGRQPNTITRLFLNFQGARAPSEDSSSRGLELPQEAVLGLKMQLVDAEAKIAAAEAAASAAAEREKSLAAEASQRERRAGNEEYYLKRRLGEVFQQLEGETLKRKQVESKLALGAYVNAMLAGTSTSVNRSDQRRSHSSSGGEGDSSDSGDAAGIRGRGAATTAPSSSSSSTTTNMQRQAALAAATRACSLDDVVAVQQRLLDKLRAGKVAAERKLAEALRSSATVTVVPSAGDVEEARSMKSEHGNARKASRGNNRDRTISSRRDSGKFRRVNPFLCEGSADANARSIALSQDAGDGEEGGEDDGDGEDDEEEDDFDVSVMSQEIESSGESNTTRAALAADRHDDSPQLEVPVAAGALKRKSAKQLKRLEADGALAMGENCVTINLVDDYTGGKRKSAKQVEWSEDTYLFDTDGLIDSVMGFTSGSIHDNHMLCKLCTYSNEPSAKECRVSSLNDSSWILLVLVFCCRLSFVSYAHSFFFSVFFLAKS